MNGVKVDMSIAVFQDRDSWNWRVRITLTPTGECSQIAEEEGRAQTATAALEAGLLWMSAFASAAKGGFFR